MKTGAILMLCVGFTHADLAQPVISPSGEYTLRNVGEGNDLHFEIRDQHGATLLSAEELFLRDFFPRAALSGLWSPGGQSVAISMKTGKYTEDVHVYTIRDGVFIPVALPAFEPDCKVIPIRWRDDHDLIVSVSGSYGGKATEKSAYSFFSYRSTFRLRSRPPAMEMVYKEKPFHPYRHR